MKIENSLIDIMTLAQALKLAAAKLSAKNINNPPLEAEILLSGVLKKPREFLLAHGEKKISRSQFAKYERLLKRRLKGEPIAYLTGHKEFYGLDFLVNKNVLIPRPETELMVEEAVKLITHSSQLITHNSQLAARSPRRITLVDVGTGSGCIIISLTKNLISKFPNSKFQFLATDISKKALSVAKKNAKLHGVDKNIKFIHGNLLEPKIKSKIQNPKSKIFLANLPYGWPAWKNNCSMDTVGLKFEPKTALFTDKHGLGLYEKLFQQIKKLRDARLALGEPRRASYGLRDIFVLCEFDPRQTAMMKKLIRQELPEAKCQIKKDLAGLNRLAIIRN